MHIATDSRGNQYVEVENVRITYVRAADRDPDADWAGTDVFRVQAYKGDKGSKALHLGAELMLPRDDPEAMLAVIAALCELWRTTHAPTAAAVCAVG